MNRVMAVLLLVALSSLDAGLTIHEGGWLIEANPLMRWLLQHSITSFWVYKTVGVGICGVLLALRSPLIAWLLVGAYSVLALYHLFILFGVQ